MTPTREATARVAAALVATSLGAVALLTGCASGPTDADRATWSAWAEQAVAASDHGVSGVMSTDASAPAVGTRVDPPQRYAAVELRCIGTDSAHVTLHYTGSTGELTTAQDIVCHGGGPLTPIAIPTSVGDLAAIEVSATSPDGEGAWIAIPQRRRRPATSTCPACPARPARILHPSTTDGAPRSGTSARPRPGHGGHAGVSRRSRRRGSPDASRGWHP